ncbi:serine/threonine-protein kinase [Aporhodopirellula aestuarii]|uniref:Serine/threonine-protein kinase n=1 Tax=Aporhodopirellula aestuarii TaxID=2950107 RepID=A0ABT0UAH1_9BACT|nr:serine/threonine-protein kinase [Aporhodopirellula aestuarii]MCM2373331.1 serine/threonine-protein kinase [Aporhodopirellula aestuarii]
MSDRPTDDVVPQPADEDSQLDEAFALYLNACDSGELSSREEFLNQFPDLSERLRELMEAADMLGSYTHIRKEKPEPPKPSLAGKEGEPGGESEATSGSYLDFESIDNVPPIQANPIPPVSVRRGNADGETVAMDELGPYETTGDFSGLDPHATLPVPNRPRGQDGPSLPFEMEDYTLLKVLGVGGMGVVYLAKQRDLDRLVAVKMIRSGMLAGKGEVRRFYTEARAAARLRHPNIVAVHQFGRRAGHHFFSMQYIEGKDLQRVLKKGPLPPRRAAEIVRDVARAIEHAHSRGVLHRDLKPGNVMIDLSGQIHVTDFGLAKHVDADSSLTGSGEAVGTPHYMAPEQAVGNSDAATHQSDIYSLGGILFAAVAGRPPLVGDTVMQTLMRVAHHPAPALRSVCPHVDADLDAIVEKCLEKQPQQRYASAGELADDLDSYLAGGAISARSKGRLGKVIRWMRQVPVVAALTGHPSTDAPIGQRRLQSSLLLLMILVPILFLMGSWWHRHRIAAMPRQVRLAGGVVGGLYTDASEHIANAIGNITGSTCDVVSTQGAIDNRSRLLAGEVHLAPMQASAIGGDQLAVVAPLFYEAVHVLVRSDGSVKSIADLAGHSIAVGPEGSGSRRAAELILDSLNLDEDVCPRVVIEWPTLSEVPSESKHEGEIPSVAIICIGPGSELVRDLLAEGRWELIPLTGSISIALQHPTLLPMTLQRAEYPTPVLRSASASTDESVIETLGTTAFLVCRRDASNALVRATLEAIYSEPTLVGLIPASRAAEWQGLVTFHAEAREYFNAIEQ